MNIKILGLQTLNFTTASGDEINGTNLFCGFEDAAVIGIRTEKFFINENITLPEGLKPGMIVNADFNHKGRLTAISMISK